MSLTSAKMGSLKDRLAQEELDLQAELEEVAKEKARAAKKEADKPKKK